MPAATSNITPIRISWGIRLSRVEGLSLNADNASRFLYGG